MRFSLYVYGFVMHQSYEYKSITLKCSKVVKRNSIVIKKKYYAVKAIKYNFKLVFVCVPVSTTDMSILNINGIKHLEIYFIL